MRKSFAIIFLLACCCTMLACKKNRGPANGNSVQPNNSLDTLVSMTASINGQPWQTDSAYGNFVKYSGNDSAYLDLLITATQPSTTSSIEFTITNYTGPATYRISPPAISATYYYGNQRFYATTGQIVILSDTAHAMIGTFNFNANSATVTDGNFNVALP